MRQKSAFSVRPLAFTAVFVLCVGVPACGREAFDLLGPAAAASGSAGLSSAAAGGGLVSNAGGGLIDSAGSGGLIEPDAGSGAGGSDAGGASGSAGVGGLLDGGAAGMPPHCLGSAGCPNITPACSTSAPFCTLCQNNHDCPTEAPTCDTNLGRCIECLSDIGCAANKECNRTTFRCGTACSSSNDCINDPSHLMCDPALGVCVSCTLDSHCPTSVHSPQRCYEDTCVECFENRQCASQVCMAGHCLRPH